MVRLLQDEQKQEGTTTPCARGPTGEGGIPRAHLIEAGSREKKTCPVGPKIPEEIQSLPPKNHKRLSFRERESRVKLGSDSSRTPPHLSLSDFCLQSDSSSSLPEAALKEEKFSKGRKQSNTADLSQLPISFGVRNNGMRSEPSQDKGTQRSMLPEHDENTKVTDDD